MKYLKESGRRTNRVVGGVNFPIDSKEYTDSKEGGLFVELWVIEKVVYTNGACCGYGGVKSCFDGNLVGTDLKRNTNKLVGTGENTRQTFPLENELFPELHNTRESRLIYLSHDLLACVTIGSTGWSGYSNKKGMWRCKFDDLNVDGKKVVDSLKSLYTNAEFRLVTWLDT